MRDALVWVVLLAAGAGALVLRPVDPWGTPLTDRLRTRLAGAGDAAPPAAAPSTAPPPRAGAPAAPATLRHEAVQRARAAAEVVASECRPSWLVYRAADGGWPARSPRVHPLTGPTAVIVDGDVAFHAGWVTSTDAARHLWRLVGSEARAAPEGVAVVAAGAHPDALVLAPGGRADGRWRCWLVLAAADAYAVVHPRPPAPSPSGILGEIARPDGPRAFAAGGARFEAVAPDGSGPVPALVAGDRAQAFVAVEVAGVETPRLFAWDGVVQRAGVLRLPVPPASVTEGPVRFRPVLQDTEVAALGAPGLVHSLPGVR